METEKRWGGITLAELSQEQINFLKGVLANPKENKLLTGCAGSGKTLLAAYAIDLLRAQINIDAGFIVFTKLLKKFVHDNFESASSDYPIDYFHNWSMHPKKRSVYIIDESQDFQLGWINKVREFSESQIWIGDEQQQIYEEAREEAGFKNLRSSFSSHQITDLLVNRRNSIKIAQFASNFLTISQDDKIKGISLNEKKNKFLKPMIYSEQKHDFPVRLIKAKDIDEEFDALAQVINNIQSNTDHSVGKKIAISHMVHSTLDEIQRRLKKRGIITSRIAPGMHVEDFPDLEQKNLVLLCAIHSLKGLEVDHVIFPRAEFATDWKDPEIRDNLLFVLFTRSRFNVICSYIKEDNYLLDKIPSYKTSTFIEHILAAELLHSVPATTADEPDIEDDLPF